MTPKERTRRAAEAMWARDEASRWFGFELGPVDEGHAHLTVQVASHHCNGHGICHGGVIFALADSAFAFACNSRNQSTVAHHNVITYIAPARSGDTLTAEAHEVSLSGRNGIYDVTVQDQDGRYIAAFRGMSRAISGAVFEE